MFGIVHDATTGLSPDSKTRRVPSIQLARSIYAHVLQAQAQANRIFEVILSRQFGKGKGRESGKWFLFHCYLSMKWVVLAMRMHTQRDFDGLYRG